MILRVPQFPSSKNFPIGNVQRPISYLYYEKEAQLENEMK